MLQCIPRTHCDCDDCKSCCATLPGMLAPGDLEAILDSLGIAEDVRMEFVLATFEASAGALVQKGDKRFRIETIVPRLEDESGCVFWSLDERCTIHNVAPYGCAKFDTHMDRQQADPISANALRAIMEEPEDGFYKTALRRLKAAGRVVTAKQVSERRGRLQDRLDDV